MILTGFYIWHVCWTAPWFFEGGFSVKLEVFLMNAFLAKIIGTLLRHALSRPLLAVHANCIASKRLRCNFQPHTWLTLISILFLRASTCHAASSKSIMAHDVDRRLPGQTINGGHVPPANLVSLWGAEIRRRGETGNI